MHYQKILNTTKFQKNFCTLGLKGFLEPCLFIKKTLQAGQQKLFSFSVLSLMKNQEPEQSKSYSALDCTNSCPCIPTSHTSMPLCLSNLSHQTKQKLPMWVPINLKDFRFFPIKIDFGYTVTQLLL